MTTPKLQMPELVVGQAGKELTHNQALAVLDQLAQAVVIDKDLTAPPGSPANGAMYIVAAPATGAWSGQSGKLAYWLTTVAAWTFINPADGWSVWVGDEDVRYELKAGVWTVVSSGGGGGGFAYDRTNILGTVSQSAGVPAGAIIERGSNANGEYVRFADGTQICTFIYNELGYDISTAYLGGYRGGGVIWVYPAAFVAKPSVQATPEILSGFGCGLGTQSSTQAVLFWFSVTTQAAAGRMSALVAVGRWF